MEKELICIEHLTAGYEGKNVLRDVSLNIYPKDFLGIIGPNGGGKTTLLKIILGLLKPKEGQVRFFRDGIETDALRIGYLPQMNRIDRRFPISVREVVASGLASEKPCFRDYTPVQKERILEVLRLMGLVDIRERPISDLSGGQLQRVLLGRSMVSRPEVLILDEPNSYVDKRFESHFYKLLPEINKESCIILVSHDIGTVLSMVKNIACVNETLHYHPGADLSPEWLEGKYACPIELIGHGNLPHRVLKNHTHNP